MRKHNGHSVGEDVMQDPNPISLEVVRQKLYAAVVSDALDQLGCRDHSPRTRLMPMTTTTLLAGRAKTTLWSEMAHEDPAPYALELKAVDSCQSDDVVIGAAAGSMRSGVWGELLTTAARNQGCVGAIIEGAVRDVARMREMEFPVYARGSCVLDSLHRQRVVDIDVAVEIGGVTIRPGDLVLADEDGMVVVPRELEREAITKALAKVTDEDEVRVAIQNGMKASEAFDKFGVL